MQRLQHLGKTPLGAEKEPPPLQTRFDAALAAERGRQSRETSIIMQPAAGELVVEPSFPCFKRPVTDPATEHISLQILFRVTRMHEWSSCLLQGYPSLLCQC